MTSDDQNAALVRFASGASGLLHVTGASRAQRNLFVVAHAAHLVGDLGDVAHLLHRRGVGAHHRRLQAVRGGDHA